MTQSSGKQADKTTFTHLDYLLNKEGIDRLALISYVGHLGTVYSRGEAIKDQFVELQSKMISLKEMKQNVVFGLPSSEPS